MKKKIVKTKKKNNNDSLRKKEIDKVESVDEVNKTNKVSKVDKVKKVKNQDLGKKNKKRWSTILSVLVLMIIIVFGFQSIIKLVQNPTNTVFVKEGIIAKEETDVGYIIRDETVVKGDNYKNGMEQIIDEGQKVAKGESIFRYYSNGEEDLKAKIAELDEEIEKAIGEDKDNLFSSDTKLLDTQIDEKLYQLYNVNDIQKIQENKKIIDGFLTKKAEIAGELSPKGSHLKELINSRSDYQKQLREDSEYIMAPSSGILSYKIDGLEETLNTQDFSKYNKEFLSNLNLKSGQFISTNTEEGKVVSSFECYIICTSKTDEAKQAKIGDKVKIILPSTREVSAEVNSLIQENDDETTICLKIENGIDELLNYRKITFDIIWWNARGYKVPNSAIFQQGDLNYVIRTKMGVLEKTLVKLVKETDGSSIVKNYSSSEIRELQIDSSVRKSILLNDEILVNPTQEQIDSTQ